VIPDLSVFWVIFFVLLLTAILNQLLFRPVIRVITAREGAVRDARALADSANQQAAAALNEFETRTRAAPSNPRPPSPTRARGSNRKLPPLALVSSAMPTRLPAPSRSGSSAGRPADPRTPHDAFS
jgi:hypothetical protein